MAKKPRPPVNEIGQVRIPGRFLYTLSDFWRSLDRKIIDKAAAKAFARKSGINAGRITTEDMIQAAQEVLPSSVDELQQQLTPKENLHVSRRAS